MGALADGCAAWLHDGSRVSGDVQARFCESLGVRFPGATHLVILSRGCAAEALDWTRSVMTRIGLTLNEAKTSIKQSAERAV